MDWLRQWYHDEMPQSPPWPVSDCGEDLNSLLFHPLRWEINTFCELIDLGLWYSKDQVKLDTLDPQCARREPTPTSLGSILQQQYMGELGFQEFWRLFSDVRRAALPFTQSARPSLGGTLLFLLCLIKLLPISPNS